MPPPPPPPPPPLIYVRAHGHVSKRHPAAGLACDWVTSAQRCKPPPPHRPCCSTRIPMARHSKHPIRSWPTVRLRSWPAVNSRLRPCLLHARLCPRRSWRSCTSAWPSSWCGYAPAQRPALAPGCPMGFPNGCPTFALLATPHLPPDRCRTPITLPYSCGPHHRMSGRRQRGRPPRSAMRSSSRRRRRRW